MIVTLILAAEVAFWVVLGLALTARYLLRRRTLSTALLIGLPVLDLTLFTLAVLDLRGGATASWTHALAAGYAGFSLGFGPSLVRWADRHFQYRFAGGPKPQRPPKYGAARARYEWQVAGRTTVSAGVTLALITLMVPLSAGAAHFSTFSGWYLRLALIAGINLLVAAGYSIWPKEAPAGSIVEDGRVVGWRIPQDRQQ
ncbi:hypothetical protein [Kitasatospora sp. NBC_00458]|uniref:hypothetical protein n=1 Tax=Kitasatospora sp. NBC_00458 TaxID=2903568 RepID=UPI002E189838